jgi:hypothetical protein
MSTDQPRGIVTPDQIRRAFARLSEREQSILLAVAEDLATAVYIRSHGSGRLGQVGALELLAAVGKFMNEDAVTRRARWLG